MLEDAMSIHSRPLPHGEISGTVWLPQASAP